MRKLQKHELNYYFNHELLLIKYNNIPVEYICKIDQNRTRGTRDCIWCYNIKNSDSYLCITPMSMDFYDVFIISEEDDPEYFI
jgi:hypothetical protein